MTILEFKAWAEVPVYDTYIQGVTAEATYTYGPHPGVSPMFLVDNSGMDDQDAVVGGVETYLGDPNAMHNNVFGGALWHVQDAEPPESPTVTFDLGGTYDLDEILIWNEDQSVAFCTKEVLIESSTNGTTWSELADTNGDELGNYTFTAHSGEGGPYAATDTLAMNDLTASHIRFTILSDYDGEENTVGHAGLSEVRFYGTEGSSVQIPGDANHSGTVDEDDAQILATNWGASGDGVGWDQGDFNDDDKVNVADAAILAANWGYGLTDGEGTVVPEPSILMLLTAMAWCVGWKRPNR